MGLSRQPLVLSAAIAVLLLLSFPIHVNHADTGSASALEAMPFRVVIPMLAGGAQEPLSMTLSLDDHQSIAGPDLRSSYTYKLSNTGTTAIELEHLVLQSWYSTDALLGGGDDCGAAGIALGPGSLLADASITDMFYANLEPSPMFWPQCVDRASGYVIVEVHTESPYYPQSWWVSYPVSRQLSMTLDLDAHEAVAGADLLSSYTYTLSNIGNTPVELEHLVLQSWYSSDDVLGGGDDCAAAGIVLGPGTLLPGASITDIFSANLEPSPMFWPQCVNRSSGYVIVEVHTKSPYPPQSWWVSYAVSR